VSLLEAPPRSFELVVPVGRVDPAVYASPVTTEPLTPRDALRHTDGLFRLARRLTGSDADAEDLVQETFARALGAGSQFIAGTNLRAWLFRILRNAYIDSYRRSRTNPVQLGFDEELDTPANSVPDALR